MSVIVLLIAAGGLVAGGFLAAFLWAVGTGQFDDTATPPLRLLADDDARHPVARGPTTRLAVGADGGKAAAGP